MFRNLARTMSTRVERYNRVSDMREYMVHTVKELSDKINMSSRFYTTLSTIHLGFMGGIAGAGLYGYTLLDSKIDHIERELRAEMKKDKDELRAEMKKDKDELRAEMKKDKEEVKKDIDEVKTILLRMDKRRGWFW